MLSYFNSCCFLHTTITPNSGRLIALHDTASSFKPPTTITQNISNYFAPYIPTTSGKQFIAPLTPGGPSPLQNQIKTSSSVPARIAAPHLERLSKLSKRSQEGLMTPPHSPISSHPSDSDNFHFNTLQRSLLEYPPTPPPSTIHTTSPSYDHISSSDRNQNRIY